MANRERIAAIIAVVIGVPLVFFFARALADSVARANETPIRALIGNQAYDALERGEDSELHYKGNDLLAPDFILRDRHGKPWRLRDHRGKVIVMNFWSITCQPCVEEMPDLSELASLVKDEDDVEVIAVSIDRGWDAVSAIFPPRTPLKVLFDPDNSVVRGKFGTRLFPETWIIDPEGVIRLRVDGRRDWSNAIVLDAIDLFR